MTINFDEKLKTLKGEDLKEQETIITLKDVCANALLANEEKMEGRIKLENWNLAQEIYKGGEIELSSEDIVKIKNLIGKFYPTLIAGQVLKILG